MRAPFEPVGERPRWMDILDLLVPLDVNDVVTYETLSTAVGLDIRTRRGDLYAAMEVLQRDHSRTIEVVRNKGYRICAANEHGRLAKKHHKKSKRQIGKAVAKASSANRAELTDEERRRIDSMEMTLRAHGDMIRRLEHRAARTEARLQTVENAHDQDAVGQAARIDRLEEMLRRHGISN